MNDSGNSSAVTWGDYNGDGWIDLYVVKENAPDRLYHNNGNGTFTEVGASAGVDDGGRLSAAWGDYDNDGKLDLYVVNPTQNRLYHNNGDGMFTDRAVSAGVNTSGNGLSVAWGDHDNDGDLDLYVTYDGSTNRLFSNNGDGTFTDITASAGVSASGENRGVAWGDYDNDGDLDLYVARAGSSPLNLLYQNNGTPNRWLEVRLVGTVSNRAGIGALVTAVIGATRQLRHVDGGAGYSQPSLPVEFGFGGMTTVDSLIIRWPSGQVQVLTNVATNQMLTVTEPKLQLSTTTVNVGIVHKDSSGMATFTVTNSGGSTLSVSSISSSNAQFSASPTSFSLTEGASQTVTVTFTPTKVGWEQSALILTHTAAGSPDTVIASGIGRVTPPTGSLTNTRIAFISVRDGNNEIYVMNADGTNPTRLTNNPAKEDSPSWSLEGTKIAFSSSRDGNNEIYAMNADGATQTRLTNNPAEDNSPSWSPDGTKIVFYSSRDGNNEIYVMNADGTTQTRLTSNSAGDYHPSWSPDGTKIAFESNRDGTGEIYVMNADGTTQTRLTNNTAEETWARWSPDGTKITFTSYRDGNAEVYVMNADGTSQTRISNNPANDRYSSWSPDGTKLVFGSDRDGNDYEIYVMNTDGSGQTRLTTNSAYDNLPSWSPFLPPVFQLSATTVNAGTVTKGASGTATFTVTNAGGGTLSVSSISSSNAQFTASPTSFSLTAGASQLVTVTFTPIKVGGEQSTLILTHTAAGSPDTVTASGIGRVTPPTGSLTNTKIAFMSNRNGNHDIYAMNADSSNLINVTNHSAIDANPSWSPDGTQIAFASDRDDPNFDVYVMSADGTGSSTRLTTNSATDEQPAWSPDGTKIVFHSNRDNGIEEIYVMNADGSNQTRLTNNPAGDVRPAWSPDGTKIVFHSNRDNGIEEIYVMNADGSNQTRLTNNVVLDSDPVWSPDGTKIAFTSTRDGNGEVYVMNADGANPLNLTNHPTQEGDPTWSPDGAQIAFFSDRDGNQEIYKMNADGSSQTRLTNNGAVDQEPAWSPFLPPAAPQNLTASPGNAQVTLRWRKNTEPAVLRYRIYQGTSPGPTTRVDSTASASDTTKTLTGLTNGTIYYFRVTAVDSNGRQSSYSNEVSATPRDTILPATPTNLTATAGDRQVSLQWRANTEADLAYYVLYRSLTNGFTPTSADSIARITKPDTSYTDTGLTNGTTYYYRLAATDSTGNKSLSSSQVSAIPGPVLVLSATSLSFGSVEKGQAAQQTVRLKNTGTAPLIVSGVTRVSLHFSVAPTVPPNLTIAVRDSTTITVTFAPTSVGTKSDTVTITHNAPGSPTRVVLSGTGIDTTSPPIPTGLTAIAGDQRVSVSWNANLATDLAYYVLYRSLTNGFTPTSADSIARITKPDTSYTDTGLTNGTTYYYRLAATDSTGNKSLSSSQVSAKPYSPDLSGPTIIVSAPDTVSMGQPVTVSAQVSDNSGVREARVLYRSAGVLNFPGNLALSRSSGSSLFTATIPGNAIGSRGIELYIQAIDSVGNVARAPDSTASPSYLSIRVKIPSMSRPSDLLPFPAAKSQGDYRMISIPFVLKDSDPLTVLKDDLDPDGTGYRNSMWQLYRWINGQYQEYPDTGPFIPGRAFWLAVKNNAPTIDIGEAISVSTATDYSITLSPEWNQIGNPFNFKVSWALIKQATGSASMNMDPQIWRYVEEVASARYKVATELEPWEGYWVYNNNGASVTLKIPSTETTGSPRPIIDEVISTVGGKPLPHAIASNGSASQHWVVRIAATAANLADRDNFLGVAPYAAETWDPFDFSDPPKLEHYLNVYFPHDDWPRQARNYAGDFRPPVEDGLSWDFVVETDVPIEPITLNFEGLETIPEPLTASLFDLDTGGEVDLRQNTTPTFQLRLREHSRRFKFSVGTSRYLEKIRTALAPRTFVLYPNYPNPFNPTTTIRFGLPQTAHVTLKIHNILGQEVRTLVDKVLPAGYHTVIWDGRNEKGYEAASGVYFYRIQAGEFRQSHKMVLLR